MDTGALALTTRTLVGEGGPTEANTEQGPRSPPPIQRAQLPTHLEEECHGQQLQQSDEQQSERLSAHVDKG